MLRKSRSKTAQNQEAGKDGAEKLPFKTRIKACWEAAGREMTDFRQNSVKSFGKWLLVYFLFALFSLLLLNADSDLKFKEFPTVFALIIPRMFTLFLFTCPILNLRKRKSAFLMMTALWLLWHSIAFDRTKYGAGVFALLLLAAIFEIGRASCRERV